MKSIRRYKWIWITGGFGLIVLLAGLLFTRAGRTDAAGAEIGETAVAFIGDLAESATASGQIVARREANLSLAASGIVEQVNVAVGDTVTAGEVLVQLETASLERALASAEQDLVIAEAQLADLLAGASADDIAAAEAAVLSAQAGFDGLLAGPTEEEIAASEAGIRAAQANLAASSGNVAAANEVSEADILAAEANLEAALEQQEAAHNVWVLLADCEVNEDGVHECSPADGDRMESANQNMLAANAQVAIAQARLDELGNPDANNVASSRAGVASARAQYEAAVARHEALLAGASAADIAAAEADLANAIASLESLRAGPSETDIAVHEIRLAQAQTAWQQARNDLADASLLAPFGGTVTAVYISEGGTASGLAVTVVDTTSLEVVLKVDEVDVGRLAVGQPATVTLETWPDEEIEGTITAIAPKASESVTGIVSYDVHLGLQETGLPILVGMTANADLLTANLKDVLLVPNAALTADRQAGTYTVNLVSEDDNGALTTVPVEVTIGLKDNRHTQITGGLVEGDVVAIGKLVVPTQDFGPGNGNGRPFGGG